MIQCLLQEANTCWLQWDAVPIPKWAGSAKVQDDMKDYCLTPHRCELRLSVCWQGWGRVCIQDWASLPILSQEPQMPAWLDCFLIGYRGMGSPSNFFCLLIALKGGKHLVLSQCWKQCKEFWGKCTSKVDWRIKTCLVHTQEMGNSISEGQWGGKDNSILNISASAKYHNVILFPQHGEVEQFC